MFKQKRAFLGDGATNTPAGATNQSGVQESMNQNQPMSLGPQAQDDSPIYWTVEQALAYSEQLSYIDFVSHC